MKIKRSRIVGSDVSVSFHLVPCPLLTNREGRQMWFFAFVFFHFAICVNL
jgi:hypothetical protein